MSKMEMEPSSELTQHWVGSCLSQQQDSASEGSFPFNWNNNNNNCILCIFRLTTLVGVLTSTTAMDLSYEAVKRTDSSTGCHLSVCTWNGNHRKSSQYKQTLSEWWVKVPTQAGVSKSHILTVSSAEADASTVLKTTRVKQPREKLTDCEGCFVMLTRKSCDLLFLFLTIFFYFFSPIPVPMSK